MGQSSSLNSPRIRGAFFFACVLCDASPGALGDHVSDSPVKQPSFVERRTSGHRTAVPRTAGVDAAAASWRSSFIHVKIPSRSLCQFQELSNHL